MRAKSELIEGRGLPIRRIAVIYQLRPLTPALRVFERGAGETLACGTGACAAVVHGIRKNLLNNAVTVHLPGGKLSVAWEGNGTAAWLSGPTASVFEGTINLHNR